MASHAGPEAALVSDVMQLAANDIGPRAISDDLEQLVQQASTQQASADAKQDDPARKRPLKNRAASSCGAGMSQFARRYPPHPRSASPRGFPQMSATTV